MMAEGYLNTNTHADVFPSLLDDLTNRKYTGHDAIAQINGFESATDHGDLVYKIIDQRF